MSYSKTILEGNLGRDPEIVTFDNGNKLAKLALATTDKWTTKAGEKGEKTQWHRVEFGGPIVDSLIIPYVKKGQNVLVDGSIDYQKYQDSKTGEDKYSTVIKGQAIQLLGGKSDSGQTSAPAPQRSQQGAPPAAEFDKDIPFLPLPSYP